MLTEHAFHSLPVLEMSVQENLYLSRHSFSLTWESVMSSYQRRQDRTSHRCPVLFGVTQKKDDCFYPVLPLGAKVQRQHHKTKLGKC